MRKIRIFLLLAGVVGAVPCCSQENSGPQPPDVNVEVYFRRYVGLSGGQIKALRAGKAISKTLHSRTPAEIFVFGAVYVNASPDTYLAFATDFHLLPLGELMARLNSSWWALRIALGAAPLLAGLDKFFNLLTNWTMYLNPLALRVVPVAPGTFVRAVGVVEMVVGIAILTRWTRLGAYAFPLRIMDFRLRASVSIAARQKEC